MTVGSGRRLLPLLKPSGRVAVFSRILLESPTWSSTEYSLKWKEKELPEERSERWLIEWDDLFSVKRWKRLKVSVTRSRRYSIFQLAPSIVRNGGIEFY